MPFRNVEASVAYEAIFRSSPDAILVVDRRGAVIDANDRASALFGGSIEELRTVAVEDLVPLDVVEAHGAHRMRYDAEPRPRLMGEDLGVDLRARRLDGTTFSVDISLSPIELGGTRLYAAAVRDVTERREAEAALEASEARFRALFDVSPLGMALLDTESRLVEVNTALCRLLGWSRSDLVGRRLRDMMVEDGAARQQLSEDLAQLQSQHHETTIGTDLPLRTGTGGCVWAELRGARMPGGAVARSVMVFADVTDRRAAAAALAHQADHDILTGLMNRAGLLEHLERVVAQSRRDGRLVGLVFADLDRFKEVNDTHGHGIGDRVLVDTARRLMEASRSSDVVARMGGDEFVAVLQTDTTDLEEARAEVRACAERLRTACAEVATGIPEAAGMSLSVGLTIVASGDDPADVLRRADAALYRAKRRGRDLVVVDWDEPT